MFQKVLIILNIIILLYCCNVFADKTEQRLMMKSAVVSVGPYFHRRRSDGRKPYGDLIDVKNDESKMVKFYHYVNSSQPHVKLARHIHADGEAIDSIEKFFWGQEEGIVLELGELTKHLKII